MAPFWNRTEVRAGHRNSQGKGEVCFLLQELRAYRDSVGLLQELPVRKSNVEKSLLVTSLRSVVCIGAETCLRSLVTMDVLASASKS